MYLFRYKHAPISAPKYACLCMNSKTTCDVYTTFNLRNLFKANAFSKICMYNFQVSKTGSFLKNSLIFSNFVQAPWTLILSSKLYDYHIAQV